MEEREERETAREREGQGGKVKDRRGLPPERERLEGQGETARKR